MACLRILAWLFTLAALIAPPAWSTTIASAVETHAMVMDCSDHTPPPHCPDEGSSKHAAATCCPAMVSMQALVPLGPTLWLPSIIVVQTAWLTPMLHGRVPAADPPPPRI